ncbi:AAA family ATPase [Hyphococcus sp.]|uniref:AAA family ATPase n=1 Tax=Hyphococcus sp. TaxID=2038636 RepID=UPI002082F641|nr:MAG: hypothetical protein DHS20C04_30580 [Marinicaulis sp.]
MIKCAPFTAAELGEMYFDPLQFACKPILAIGATMLAGKPKTNKTWLAQEVALSVASGGVACGEWETTQGDVLFFALEDNKRRLQRRLEMLRPNGAWPNCLTFMTEAPRLYSGFEDVVRSWAKGSDQPRLVVVDTFNFIRPNRQSDRVSYQLDYADGAAIMALATELGIAILVIHHARKMDAEDPLDSISGSTGIAAGFDTVLAMSRSAEGNFKLEGRGRDVLPVEIALDFDLDNARWTVEGDPAVARVSDERKAILHHLEQSGEAGPKEIADHISVAYDVVRQLLPKMVRDGLIRKDGRGTYAPIHNVHSVHKSKPVVNDVNNVNGYHAGGLA